MDAAVAEAAGAAVRPRRFDELFGAGRGLAGRQLRERERELARPRPCHETDVHGMAVVRYYLGNDPQANILHRDDGPAVEGADGTREWWFEGQRHRDGGPAFERADGGCEWWVRGSHTAKTARRSKVRTVAANGTAEGSCTVKTDRRSRARTATGPGG